MQKVTVLLVEKTEVVHWSIPLGKSVQLELMTEYTEKFVWKFDDDYTFNKYINDIFIEHHLCVGVSMEEIEVLIADSTTGKRARWLKRVGYDLTEWVLQA